MNPEPEPELRSKLRAIRKSITGPLRDRHERAIHDAILKHLPVEGRTVASYFAIDGEVSLERLHAELFRRNYEVVLPAIAGSSKTLTFHRIDDQTEYAAAALGTQEPITRSTEVSIATIDVMLMPCVGVDESGTRIGFGAGFYDRTLGGISESKGRLPLLVAVGFEAQVCESLKREDWDVPVQAIVTEAGWRAVTALNDHDEVAHGDRDIK